MPLLYSCVARDKTVIAEHSNSTGNFSTVAAEVLEKANSTDNSFTATCDDHTFNFLVSNGYTYLVVANEEYGREVPIACLQRIKDVFEAKFSTKGQSAAAHSLDKSFGPRLKQEMQYCMEHPEEVSKVASVQKKVDEVRNVMVDNIEKVLQRGERIELLVDKTEDLKMQAEVFQKGGKKLRNQFWWQNCKMKLAVALVVLLLILTIVLAVCLGGGYCGHKKKSS